jgi:hypothetical protein
MTRLHKLFDFEDCVLLQHAMYAGCKLMVLGDLERWHSGSDLAKRTRGSAPEFVAVHKLRSARP